MFFRHHLKLFDFSLPTSVNFITGDRLHHTDQSYYQEKKVWGPNAKLIASHLPYRSSCRVKGVMWAEWKCQNLVYEAQEWIPFWRGREGQGNSAEAFATQRLSWAPMHMKLAMNICETDNPNLQCGVLVFGGLTMWCVSLWRSEEILCLNRVDLLGKLVS